MKWLLIAMGFGCNGLGYFYPESSFIVFAVVLFVGAIVIGKIEEIGRGER